VACGAIRAQASSVCGVLDSVYSFVYQQAGTCRTDLVTVELKYVWQAGGHASCGPMSIIELMFGFCENCVLVYHHEVGTGYLVPTFKVTHLVVAMKLCTPILKS